MGRLRREAVVLPDPAEIEPLTGDPTTTTSSPSPSKQAEADAIVSGDTDLTEVEDLDIPIFTPAEMLTRLTEPDHSDPPPSADR